MDVSFNFEKMQVRAMEKQLLLHMTELLAKRGLVSEEEKNMMKTIIYQRGK